MKYQISKNELDDWITPTTLFTLYLWSEITNPQSLALTFLSTYKTFAYDDSCGILSPICTPHLWTEEERQSLFPSILQGIFDIKNHCCFVSNC